MSNVRHWIVKVWEPVLLGSPETGRFKRFFVECSDLSISTDRIQDIIRIFVEAPAGGLTMLWHEFELVDIQSPDSAPHFTKEDAHVKIWHIADKP